MSKKKLLMDPEEPAGAEWEGLGCKRRFKLNKNCDAFHLSSYE